MEDAAFRIIPIECRLSQLRAIATSAHDVVTALQANQPFSLHITVEFLRSTAIALLRLSPQIRVDFYAKPITGGEGYELGTVAIAATDQLIYDIEHPLDSPDTLGLTQGHIYHIGAILRVGAAEGPALLSGIAESLMLEIYSGERPQSSDSSKDSSNGFSRGSSQSSAPQSSAHKGKKSRQ